MEYYSAIKKNEIMLFEATWMSLEIIILSEVSEKEKDKYHRYHLYIESKVWHKPIYLRNRLTDRENKLMVIKEGRGWGRYKLGIWD